MRRLKLNELPHKWNDHDIKAFRDDLVQRPKPLELKTQEGYDFIFCSLAAFYKNDVGERNKIYWPKSSRPKVRWLTKEEMQIVFNTYMTPMQDALHHIAGVLGARKCEIIRMNVSDIIFDKTYPHVILDGKGNRLRRVHFALDTERSLKRWLDERRNMYEKAERIAKKRGNPVHDCGKLFVYQKGGKLIEYSELKPGGIDEKFAEVSRRSGIEYSEYVLRRTIARLRYKASPNPDLITLASIFGHSVEMFKLYVGDDSESHVAIMSEKPF